MAELQRDLMHRFLFEHCGVRGELVRLDATWRAVRECHEYPPGVQRHLGEALAGVLLLAETIKLKGSLILQAQGDGPLSTVVAQASGEGTVRGLARWEGEIADAPLARVMGDGRLVMTIQRERGEPYQGVVPLEGESLADALRFYFRQSEQLPTGLWLSCDSQVAAGLLLQQLPSQETAEEDWERLCMLAQTITDAELSNLPTEDLLHRLFHEEQLRLFEPTPVSFRCQCSFARIESTLAALGAEQIGAYTEDDGSINVTCEFCNRRYDFDIVDIEALFARGESHDGPETRQ